MAITVREVAAELGARAVGDATIELVGVAEPYRAGPADLALAMLPEFEASLADGQARAAVLRGHRDWRLLGLEAAILVDHPALVLHVVCKLFEQPPDFGSGIHESAHVDDSAIIGPGARIGPFVAVGPQVRIGANCRIGPHVSIGRGATLGDDAFILDGARIGHDVRIGDRLILHRNAVVGGDGFSYTSQPGARGKSSAPLHLRVASIGTVVIGDDVEIGSNTTIDRATIAETTIGNGTKIDNLVQIGHNVKIGNDCIICGQVGIAGSVVIGDRCTLGGQVGIADNISLGSDVVAAGGTTIYSRVPPAREVMGSPAIEKGAYLNLVRRLRKISRLFDRTEEIERRLSRLENRSE